MIIYNEEVAKCPEHKQKLNFIQNTSDYNDEYNTKWWFCPGDWKGTEHPVKTQEWDDTIYYYNWGKDELIEKRRY